MPNDIRLRQRAAQYALGATILKCTCGNPTSHTGEVCPQAKSMPQGSVAFSHWFPPIVWLWWISRKLGIKSFFWLGIKPPDDTPPTDFLRHPLPDLTRRTKFHAKKGIR